MKPVFIMVLIVTAFLVFLVLLFPACDSGGGGGGGGIQTFTVGGTVGGLSGTLVLRCNGVDDLSITTDGPFTFATALANESSYVVTVFSKPVLQSVSITNGSGTINGVNVTNVTSNCVNKSWTHPTDLTDNISPDGEDASHPQVSMDNNGNAIIVWSQNDGPDRQIFKSEYQNGSWTHPTDLTDNISPDGTYASHPQVSMDNNGNAIIVWTQPDGTSGQIFKREYRSGSWTHPTGLTKMISPDETDASQRQVSFDNNGNVIVVWSRRVGLDRQIFKSEHR